MATRDGQFLDCGLAVEHGGDKLSVASLVLRTDDDVVAVEDTRIDHGLAADLEHEEVAVPSYGRWKVEHILHMLLSSDGGTGGNATDERDSGAFFLHVGDGHFDTNDLFRGL